MADPDEPPTGVPAEPASTGRHGGTGGLSAAELIARARAASPEGQRPSRSTRHAAKEARAGSSTGADARAAAESPAPARQLRVVEPLRSGAATKPEPGGVAVATAPATLTPLTTPRTSAPALPIAPPPRRPRAGRNLPAAIGVGAGLAALVVGTLALYRPSFVVLLSIAVAIGVYEMVTAIATTQTRPPLVPLLAGVLVMETAAWFRGPDGLVGALLLTVLGLTVWRLADGATGYLRDVAAGNLVALYVPFLAGFATLLAHADDGVARVVLFVLTVVCSDTGGYAVGVLIGKHPMAPTVSPKKSWEGFAGSLVAGGTEGVLMMVFCFHQQWWQGALFGAAVVATATLGDLGESMIKRDLGIKDMGKLLPGHGGIMDRLDSLLPCAPVAYLLLAAFLPG
jgi:phosphatidate cytidylyltransferase